MSAVYFLLLACTIACLSAIDYRFKLAYFMDSRRTIKTLATAIAVFVVWDVLGILRDIFYIGDPDRVIGLRIGQFPIEEILFLAVLCYNCLLIFNFLSRASTKRRGKND